VRKVLSVVVALSMMLMLSAGAAMAKNQDGEKDNAGNTKAAVQSDSTLSDSTLSDSTVQADSESNGKSNGESKVTGQEHKSYQGQQLKEFKQKLDAYQGQGEVEEDIPDINGHWAAESIKKMKAIGVFEGYEDGTFRPEDSITQAEITVLVMRMANKNTWQEDNQLTIEDLNLEDVPDWARESVREAVYKGVVNINRFQSQVQADRALVAVELAKALELTPVDTEDIPFADGSLISPEDLGYIMALYQEGIIVGSPEGKFNPNSAITRAEMAVIAERVINQTEVIEDTEQETESDTEQ